MPYVESMLYVCVCGSVRGNWLPGQPPLLHVIPTPIQEDVAIANAYDKITAVRQAREFASHIAFYKRLPYWHFFVPQFQFERKSQLFAGLKESIQLRAR